MKGVCGKCILGGEHSVVYHGRALALPIPDVRLRIEGIPDRPGLEVNGRRRSEAEWQTLRQLIALYGGFEPGGLAIHSTIPIGAGLGSSAALCAALAQRYTGAQGVELARLALAGERLFHGTPSGVDPFTVALERPILFEAGTHAWSEVSLAPLRAEGLRFVLKDSGARRATGQVIQAVTGVRADTPRVWEASMQALAAGVEEMVEALATAPRRLGPLMNASHEHLRALGVSCEAIEATARTLRAHGALGAKLTGAGRGGFVLGLFEQATAAKLPHTLGSEGLLPLP